MPQGQVAAVPDDGLTTRQRRNRPLVIVHTGQMKGKSTAAFGLALRGWSAGWSIGVFQFVKSAKWKVGEEAAFRALGRLHAETGEGGPVEWHKMGDGWSWARKPGSEDGPRRRGGRGLGGDPAADRVPAPPALRARRVQLPAQLGVGGRGRGRRRARPPEGRQHVIITGRDAPTELVAAADLVMETTKIKHPMDAGQKGQRGIEW